MGSRDLSFKNKRRVYLRIFKMISKSSGNRIIPSFLVLLFIQTIFMANYCNGQFHWAKNPRLEVQKLRDFLQEMRFDGTGAIKTRDAAKIDLSDSDSVWAPVRSLLRPRDRRNLNQKIMVCRSFGPMSTFKKCKFEDAPDHYRF